MSLSSRLASTLSGAALSALVAVSSAGADEKPDLTATDDLNISTSDTCNMGVVGAGIDQRYDNVFDGLSEDDQAYLLARFETAKDDMKAVLDCSESDGRFYVLVRDLMHGDFEPDARRAMFDEIVEIVRNEKVSELALFKLSDGILDFVDSLALHVLMDHEGQVNRDDLKAHARAYAKNRYQEFSLLAMRQEMADFFEIPDAGTDDIPYENGYALMADVRKEIERYLAKEVEQEAGISNGVVPVSLDAN